MVTRCGTVLGSTDVDLGLDLDRCREDFATVQAFEAWRSHGSWIRKHPGALTATVAKRFAQASSITPERHDAARIHLQQAANTLRDLLTDAVLLLPTTATLPPLVGAEDSELQCIRNRTLKLTCLASIAGLPAVTFPYPFADNTPIGICLIGGPETDRALVRFARSSVSALTQTPHTVQEMIR